MKSLRSLLTLAAAGGFVAVGVAESGLSGAKLPAATLEPQNALAKHADYGSGRPGSLPALTAAIDALPPATPLVLLLEEGSERAAVAAQVVSYLAWPRPLEQIGVTPAAHSQEIRDLRRRYGGVILCGPRMPVAEVEVSRIGPGIEILEGRP